MTDDRLKEIEEYLDNNSLPGSISRELLSELKLYRRALELAVWDVILCAYEQEYQENYKEETINKEINKYLAQAEKEQTND